jgi:thioredoxin 2
MDKSSPIHVACAHCGTKNRVVGDRLADDPLCGRCGRALLEGQPVELTDDNFEAVTAGTDLPVVVDFWAPWCGPCRAMAPQFESAASSLRGRALLVKVNSDDNPKAAARFGIRSIPTLMLFRNGKLEKQVAGAMSAPQLTQAFGL